MTSIAPLLMIAATVPLRNPFWPVGHTGTMEIITDEPRVVVQAPVQKEEEEEKPVAPVAEPEPDQAQIAAKLWSDARKALKIGGKMNMGGKHAITINGKIYSDGDLVSVTVQGKRFTWRITGLTDTGSLRLRRVRMRDK